MSLYGNYRDSHTHPVNRALHMIAIPVGFSSLVVVWFRPLLGLLLIPAAFALAWIGHLIEGNRPASFSNPAQILMAPVWLVRALLRRESPKQ